MVPESRAAMKLLLDLTEPGVSDTAEDRELAAGIEEALNGLLAHLSARYGDTRPPLTISCGGRPCGPAT
jgi:hypothetical protein